ncbi:MAG: COQ9 family protein [Alphaproteobacteria bacterium]|nr:COQ9 family protein [Alphaproteobacteria bacterium]
MTARQRRPSAPQQPQRDKAIRAVLAQIPFDGWTQAAFVQGMAQIGLPQGEASLLFPQGIQDIIVEFGRMADTAMEERIRKDRGFIKLRIREKIAFAVRVRLEFLLPYREAMRRLMIWYAMPLHWHLGARRLYRTVDLMWRAAGDTSTDFNFYTKRGLLAGVVKATTLFWLDDESPNCRASWEFLDRRIAEVLKVGQTLSKLKTG